MSKIVQIGEPAAPEPLVEKKENLIPHGDVMQMIYELGVYCGGPRRFDKQDMFQLDDVPRERLADVALTLRLYRQKYEQRLSPLTLEIIALHLDNLQVLLQLNPALSWIRRDVVSQIRGVAVFRG